MKTECPTHGTDCNTIHPLDAFIPPSDIDADPGDIKVSHAFTISELEKMLANAKAGGSVEVVFNISKEVILR